MNNFYKYSFYTLTIIGLGALGYWAFRKAKASGRFPLKRGASGYKVAALQRFLNKEDNANLEVNGKFDKATADAWEKMQSPWEGFQQSWPNAKKGQVHEDYYNTFIKKYEHPEAMSGGNTQDGTNSNSNSSVFPLKKGSQGEEVKLVQRLLNENFNAGLPVNGNFDSATEAALISAQNSFKVKTALRVYGTPNGYAIGQVSQDLYNLLVQNA